MMEYRKLPHGEEQISVIGFGTSSIGASGRAGSGRPEAHPRFCQCAAAGKGLFCPGNVCPEGSGRNLRVLQPLPAVSCRAGRGIDQ